MPEFLQIKHFVIVPDDFGWGNIKNSDHVCWVYRGDVSNVESDGTYVDKNKKEQELCVQNMISVF